MASAASSPLITAASNHPAISRAISELAKAIGPRCELKEVGIRPGEKIWEELISPHEQHVEDRGRYYVLGGRGKNNTDGTGFTSSSFPLMSEYEILEMLDEL